ncbi:DEAD/DEAH box helicase family protein [Mesomycoplasma ovipneumoniae]|uniref:type I site-specific deoxyribonuclease n=1 Tax=Mesomycoplasma ovipneumoniae TaxID=29562 RepID=A0AAJ2UE19_9BACT|nr:type I restriction endonuclease [Mesomycoplasma ovipneumoniae]MDW2906560.1 DEAD/DEAH box helicase family protein [Mesomycoplasma ovipneumoniae]MDW2914514.1 DEAD/DEAH box helicase family protein [Mesomycoplasma ovipneumoniae]
MAEFNEKTRVQIPALVHLLRLGYKCLGRNSDSKKSFEYDATTNIAVEIFKEKFFQLNPTFNGDFNEILREIKHDLNNDDLGMSFYNRLISYNQKLIDFDNIKNNSFHFTGEFSYRNEGDELRPDITLFINGLPLVFIEVKTPNNPGGVVAEAERMNKKRLPNSKFRRYINISQLMIFSNNMEYDNVDGIAPVEGAFYSTAAKEKAFFNCFREDSDKFINDYPYGTIDRGIEKQIIGDFNAHTLLRAPEYKINLDFNTPTNRIITSLCSPERLLFIIKYGIAYLNYNKEVDGNIQQFNLKHIMRYQQLLATLAVRNTLNEGKKSGIIWHTQGSGKTALSYYLIKYLTDHFSSQNKVAKFYFIVDRLDLLEQAKQEFEYRGLAVKTHRNKEELMAQFQTSHATEGTDGKMEITVVNIQRFDEKDKINIPDYSVNLQRIFIIDEAHRSYKKGGSFLANLFNADTDSIKIALTGTPLLKKDKESWSIFGNYIHTYYYDKSIKDGYTLKIIREDVETSCKFKLEKIYDSLQLQELAQKKDVKKSYIIEHDSYVEELTKFIIKDFKQFRISRDNNSLGGMVICETSTQAEKIYEFFNKIQSNADDNEFGKTNLKAALILHDIDDKATRMEHIDDFKKGKNIDILIVFNMLLTGFDAPRLKKIYFGRKLTDHTLLQAITRVNRPYEQNTYGYIIDFADIKKNFDDTNKRYLQELQKISEVESYDLLNSIIEDKDKLIENVKNASNKLFKYTINNLEIFDSEISEINDKKHLIDLRNILFSARDAFNLVRTWGDAVLKEKFNKIKIEKLPILITLLTKRINIVNQKLALKDNESFQSSINEIMNNIEFIFKKTSVNDELKIVSTDTDILKEKLVQLLREVKANIDTKDPEYSSLVSIIRAKLAERGYNIVDNIDNMDEFNEYSTFLDETLSNIKKINKDNNNLLAKYDNDQRFVRIHKRILEFNKKHADEKYELILSNNEIMNVLKMIKNNIDNEIYNRNSILKNQGYFKKTISSRLHTIFEEEKIKMDDENIEFIINNIEEEYTSQIKQ